MLKKVTLQMVVLLLSVATITLFAQEDRPDPENRELKQPQGKKQLKQKGLKQDQRQKEPGQAPCKAKQQTYCPMPIPEPAQSIPRLAMFEGWLDELTRAFEENNRDKMGQLLKQMQDKKEAFKRPRSAQEYPQRTTKELPQQSYPHPYGGYSGPAYGYGDQQREKPHEPAYRHWQSPQQPSPYPYGGYFSHPYRHHQRQAPQEPGFDKGWGQSSLRAPCPCPQRVCPPCPCSRQGWGGGYGEGPQEGYKHPHMQRYWRDQTWSPQGR